MSRSLYRLVEQGGRYGVGEVRTYCSGRAGEHGVTLLSPTEWCESREEAEQLLEDHQRRGEQVIWAPLSQIIADLKSGRTRPPR